mmetsp:Transcript_42680/g.71223  ORF Transcript_42680/g.71223 Transcript_42680/m.71223 type:complete len:210 (-) Transcript_42680:554-1183(-)
MYSPGVKCGVETFGLLGGRGLDVGAEGGGGLDLSKLFAAGRYFPMPDLCSVNSSVACLGLLNHCPFSSSSGLGSASSSSGSGSGSGSEYGFTKMVTFWMIIACSGRSSESVCTFSMAESASPPPTSLPKTVCLLSKCFADLYMMKNWDPFVWGPELAILSTPRPSCVRLERSSSLKGCPQMDLPPVPSPLGSPPCTMKFLMLRWNPTPS